MVSAVRSRPNHYETLGLASSASETEIEQAFARKMGELRWHPVGSKAVICIAYETLRDPAKRAAYDRSLGLISKTAPRQWGFAMAPQRWAFIAAQPGTAPLAEPHVTAGSQAQRQVDPSDARPERHHVEQMVSARLAEEEAADRSFAWKRPILAVGGFVIAAGLIGTLAGLSVTDNEAPAQAEARAVVGRPVGAAQAAAATPSTTAGAAVIGADHVDSPSRSVSKQRPSAWAKRQIHEAQSSATGAGQSEAFASSDLSSDPLAPQPAAAATLPLSNSAVANTLDRIGYSCGRVASTAATSGGAFSVTCTSGKTYRAKRVHGRYRFSPSGGE